MGDGFVLRDAHSARRSSDALEIKVHLLRASLHSSKARTHIALDAHLARNPKKREPESWPPKTLALTSALTSAPFVYHRFSPGRLGVECITLRGRCVLSSLPLSARRISCVPSRLAAASHFCCVKSLGRSTALPGNANEMSRQLPHKSQQSVDVLKNL